MPRDNNNPDIILVLPPKKVIVKPVPIPGYSIEILTIDKDSWWIDIHQKAVPTFKESNLKEWLMAYRELSLHDGILVALDDLTGSPIATAGSLANSKQGMFPKGG